MNKAIAFFLVAAIATVACKPRRSGLSSADYRDPYKCENSRLDNLFIAQQDGHLGSWETFGTPTIEEVKLAKDLLGKAANFARPAGETFKLAVMQPMDAYGRPTDTTWRIMSNGDTALLYRGNNEVFRINKLAVQYIWLTADHRQIFLLVGHQKKDILRIDLAAINDQQIPAINSFLALRTSEIKTADFSGFFANPGMPQTYESVGGAGANQTRKDRTVSRVFQTWTLKRNDWFASAKQYEQTAAWGGTLVRGAGKDRQYGWIGFIDLLREGQTPTSAITSIVKAVSPIFASNPRVGNSLEFTGLATKQIPTAARTFLYATYKTCTSKTVCIRGILVFDSSDSSGAKVYEDLTSSEVEGGFYALALSDHYPPMIAIAESSAINTASGTTVKILQPQEKLQAFESQTVASRLLKTIVLVDDIQRLSFEKNQKSKEGSLVLQQSFGKESYLTEVNIERMLHGISIGTHDVASVNPSYISWKASLIRDSEAFKAQPDSFKKLFPVNKAVEALTFGPDCLKFVSGGSDGSLKVWDLADLALDRGAINPKNLDHKGEIDGRIIALKSKTDLKSFFAASESGKVITWNFSADGDVTGPWESPDAPPLPLDEGTPTKKEIAWNKETQYTAATWVDDQSILLLADPRGQPPAPAIVYPAGSIDLKHLFTDMEARKVLPAGTFFTTAMSVPDNVNNVSLNREKDPLKKGTFYAGTNTGCANGLTTKENKGGKQACPEPTDPDCKGAVLDMTVPYHGQWIITSHTDGCILRQQNRLLYDDKIFRDMSCLEYEDGVLAFKNGQGDRTKREGNLGELYFHGLDVKEQFPVTAIAYTSGESVVSKLESLKSLNMLLTADISGTLNIFSVFRRCRDTREPKRAMDQNMLRASLSRKNEPIRAMTVTSDYRYAVTGAANGSLVLWWVSETIDKR